MHRSIARIRLMFLFYTLSYLMMLLVALPLWLSREHNELASWMWRAFNVLNGGIGLSLLIDAAACYRHWKKIRPLVEWGFFTAFFVDGASIAFLRIYAEKAVAYGRSMENLRRRREALAAALEARAQIAREIDEKRRAGRRKRGDEELVRQAVEMGLSEGDARSAVERDPDAVRDWVSAAAGRRALRERAAKSGLAQLVDRLLETDGFAAAHSTLSHAESLLERSAACGERGAVSRLVEQQRFDEAERKIAATEKRRSCDELFASLSRRIAALSSEAKRAGAKRLLAELEGKRASYGTREFRKELYALESALK